MDAWIEDHAQFVAEEYLCFAVHPDLWALVAKLVPWWWC
jgi:hypothetical protein